MERRIPSPGFEPGDIESHRRIVDQLVGQDANNTRLDIEDQTRKIHATEHGLPIVAMEGMQEPDDMTPVDDIPAPRLADERSMANKDLADALDDVTGANIDQAFKEISGLGESTDAAA